MNLEKLSSQIRLEITDAFISGENGRVEESFKHFSSVRSLLDILAESFGRQRYAEFNNILEAESDSFFNLMNEKSSFGGGIQSVYLLADSLGLPRPKELQKAEIKNTYSFMLKELLQDVGAYKVLPYCRRYATSETVLTKIKSIEEPIHNCHFFIHIGLNDAAERIFLEEQRVALDLLDIPLKNRIVEFGKKFRTNIIGQQNNYAYVGLEKFRSNLIEISSILKLKNAKSITFINIIPMPSAAWRRTPNLMRNFSKYNTIFYDMLYENRAMIIDLDRLAWESNVNLNLDSDLMHLSSRGHKLLAKVIYERIKARN